MHRHACVARPLFALMLIGALLKSQSIEMRHAAAVEPPQAPASAKTPNLKLLFLSDKNSHKPSIRFQIIQPVLAKNRIELIYTEDIAGLNSKILNEYDGLGSQKGVRYLFGRIGNAGSPRSPKRYLTP